MGADCDPLALKTDAPGDVVFDVFRAYFREKQLPQDEKWEARQPEGFVKRFLLEPATGKYDFTVLEELKDKEYEFARFPGNPEANWGPKARGSLKRSNVESN